jgi:hypothetical protein
MTCQVCRQSPLSIVEGLIICAHCRMAWEEHEYLAAIRAAAERDADADHG